MSGTKTVLSTTQNDVVKTLKENPSFKVQIDDDTKLFAGFFISCFKPELMINKRPDKEKSD